MTPRERVRAVLNGQPVDRLPVDLWHTPEIGAALRAHFRADDDLAVYRRLGLDKIVWVSPHYRGRAADQTGAAEKPGAETDTWGVPLTEVQAGEARYLEAGAPPLAGCETAAEIERYAGWPEPAGFDFAEATGRARTAAAEFAVLGPWVSCFEIYCKLRGLEQALVDLVENESLVEAALDRIESIQSEMMRRFFASARPHVDLGFVSDDIAGQTSLLMSIPMWERHLRSRLRRWCELIHAHGVKVLYHTDGAARPLLGRILDCGVDVLNPVQHACPGMDRAELKREFGTRVVFHGGVDNQTVLPRGTAGEVRAETRACLRTLGAGRAGYICCSCHNVQAGTPLDNLFAMIETVHAS